MTVKGASERVGVLGEGRHGGCELGLRKQRKSEFGFKLSDRDWYRNQHLLSVHHGESAFTPFRLYSERYTGLWCQSGG